MWKGLQEEPGGRRWRLLKDYFLIKLRELLGGRWIDSYESTARVLNFDVQYCDYGDFVILFQDIFMAQCYKFESRELSPRILDCGANIGMATLYFKSLYPQAQIDAFEPDPSAFGSLLKNIETNSLSGVICHNVALGESENPVRLYERRPGSLRASTVAGAGDTLEVECVTLSRFVDRPIDLLKLDIEGAENDVLADLERSGVLHQVRRIVVEYHHHMTSDDDRLGQFLCRLEGARFGYQMLEALFTSSGQYQTMIIVAYNKALRNPVN